ncbi:MAG: stage II sporulation protein R [Clostridia bacterium]|nr:stage II sporulation protein R [Clostridia bacterium]
MKNFIKSTLILLFLLLLYVFISAHNYVSAVSSDLSDAVFRLHVLANSDSAEDQELKLKVRDALLNYMNGICSNCSTKEEAISLVESHKNEFIDVAERTIQENGYDYSVKINIGNFYFPTKNYGDISLPASFYDALRVEIGDANGKNWWCVMFPSLCFIDVSSGIVDDEAKENLENNMDQESYNIISDAENSDLKLKFRLIEFFAEKGLFTAKN